MTTIQNQYKTPYIVCFWKTFEEYHFFALTNGGRLEKYNIDDI